MAGWKTARPRPRSTRGGSGDSDPFAAWSVRQAIRRIGAWDKRALIEALLDERRLESALRLTDESWALPVVDALTEALSKTGAAPVRGRIVANLAGLYRRYPEWSGQWFGTNPLAGEFPRRNADWSPDGMKLVHQGLSLALADRASSVRFQAIVGMSEVGQAALPQLRAALIKESDATNQGVLIEALGTLSDPMASPILAAIVRDSGRAEAVRMAAIKALAGSRDAQSLRARLALLYDANAPAPLVASTLPDLARTGILPPNELASFLEHPAASVRAAAILSLNVKTALPDYLQQSVLDRLMDQDPLVREAAMLAAVPLQLRAAIPRLMVVAGDPRSQDRTAAMEALCGMPDPRALPVYLAAIEDRNPRLRRAGESALLVIRDRVADELRSTASGGKLTESAAMTLERVLARFAPIREWRVIGPFPRTAPIAFVGQPVIDFAEKYKGAEGRPIAWNRRPADPASGRVVLDDFKHGAGDLGGFGYDTNGSPDLCAFAYAEVEADRAGPSLLLIGSSGTLIVTVNEKIVYQFTNFAGRGYAPDTDTARIELAKGKNPIVVVSRQGIGAWAFGLKLARLEPRSGANGPAAPAAVAELGRFALEHAGDPKRGEAIFFDLKGVGCARCHTVAGQGTAAIGPDLTGLAAKYDRAEVIRSVLDPSNRIATGYQPVIVATRDGTVETGVVRAESDSTLELADAEARITRIPKSDIEVRRVGNISVMPVKLVERLSPPDFADLISFLLSQKQPSK